MKSENGLSLELSEVFQAVEISDVLVIGLPHLASRLLFDVRRRGDDGPAIRFVPPVRTPEERFAYLRTLRPGFGDPEKYVFIQWPLGVESLETGAIWRHITEHCVAAGGEAAGRECDGLLTRLRELDRQEDRDAVHGRTYRTLWPPAQG